MIIYHLGPQLGVWIMQLSTFSSVLINMFHCTIKFWILALTKWSYNAAILGLLRVSLLNVQILFPLREVGTTTTV